ncbi:MAG: hypothetical protein MZW92_29715 [Comamonadaceae bacterium]|nr:hypothetical protein [Comamonadaceae bacterium]
MDTKNLPSLADIRTELRARLLADVMRLAGLFGERAFSLANKDDKPMGLVPLDLENVLRRPDSHPRLDDIDLDALPVGLTVAAMYDYAFEARHPIGMSPDVFSADVELVEDFVLSFSSDQFDLFFADPLYGGAAPSGALRTLCEHTWARLNLDTGRYVSIKEIALLADLNERSVRNMVSSTDEQQRLRASDELVENSEARRWLRGKRGFKPTVFTDVSEVPGEHPEAIANLPRPRPLPGRPMEWPRKERGRRRLRTGADRRASRLPSRLRRAASAPAGPARLRGPCQDAAGQVLPGSPPRPRD